MPSIVDTAAGFGASELRRLLEPVEVAPGSFEGRRPTGGPARLYGGLLAGQALAAAARTVRDGRAVHSIHGTFLRPGGSRATITYRVERLRDGSAVSTRRVVALHRGTPIFLLTASFHDPADGLNHHEPAPAVPPPDALPAVPPAGPEHRHTMAHMLGPFDVRYVHRPERAWVRVSGRLPDDPRLHAGVLAYASDLPLLLDAVLARHRLTWGPGGYAGASLDHTMWFHRPCRADEWLLYDCRSPWAGGARALATGVLYATDGAPVATVAQEGLLRPVPR